GDGSDVVGVWVVVRLDQQPLVEDVEVQVRGGAVARTAHQPQYLPRRDVVAHLNRDRAVTEVVILRGPAVAVVDRHVVGGLPLSHGVAVEVAVGQGGDGPIGGRQHVHPGIHAGEVGDVDVVAVVSVVGERPAAVVRLTAHAGIDVEVV